MFRFTVTGALVALALSAAACSVPGVGAAKPSPTPDPYKTALAFSQCMRDHGITDFPDPQTTGDGHIGVQINGGPSSTLDPSSSAFQAAQQACNKLLPKGGPDGKGPSAKDRAAMLAFSACMRSHGLPDFPDPQFSSDGGGVVVQAGGPGNDKPDLRPDSPQFQAAMEACKSKMPAGGGLATSGNGK
jgi:hypothetical protein